MAAESLAAARRGAAVLALDYSLAEGDPEARKPRDERFLHELRRALAPFGGWVDPGPGRVTVLFVPPFVHEAPERAALRAAVAARDFLSRRPLDEVRRWKAAISSGEVVLTEASDLRGGVFGGPVGAAKQLIESASEEEVVLDVRTVKLTGGSAIVDESGGRFVLREVRLEDAMSVPHIVGRAHELETLGDIARGTFSERRARVVFVVGQPGVGKSVLLESFRAGIHLAARTASAHCAASEPSHRPLVLLTEQLLGLASGQDPSDAAVGLASEPDGAEVVDRLRTFLGLSSDSLPENPWWAMKRVVEAVGRQVPVVLFLEDLHWAADGVLEAITYLETFCDAPLLVVGSARRKLLEARPEVGEETSTRRVLRLGPLSSEAARELVASTGARVSTETAEGLLELAGGNPLLLKELVRTGSGRPEGSWEDASDLAARLKTLLQIRVAALSRERLRLAEAAAVVGTRFAINELAPLMEAEAQQLLVSLARLADDGIVELDTLAVAGADAFRFAHDLLRDAVYDMTTKDLRSSLHTMRGEALADEGDRAAAGHHFLRAAELARELDPLDPAISDLARLGGENLIAAARESLRLADHATAAELYARGLEALPARDDTWANAAIDYIDVLVDLHEYEKASRPLNEVIKRARSDVSPVQQARARLAEAYFKAFTSFDPQPGVADELEELGEFFEPLDDHTALVKVYRGLAELHWTEIKCQAVVEDLSRALHHRLQSPSRRYLSNMTANLAAALLWGPTHTEKALEACDELQEIAGHAPLTLAQIGTARAALEALGGRSRIAIDRITSSRALLRDLGQIGPHASSAQETALIATLHGDLEWAARELHDSITVMTERGALGFAVTSIALMASVKYRLGEVEEAKELVERARTLGADDPSVVPDTSPLLAHIAADEGDSSAAREYIREAQEAAGATDALLSQAQVAIESALVLSKIGTPEEFAEAKVRALSLCDRKGAPALAALLDR